MFTGATQNQQQDHYVMEIFFFTTTGIQRNEH